MSTGGVTILGASKLYGGVCAVRRASAHFRPGRVAVVEGPNGSGKSTLLAMLATMVRPTSGSIDLRALGGSPGEVRASIGWLSNDSLAYLDLTGRDNLGFAAELFRLDARAAIARVGARIELEAVLDRPLKVCSRGQRQRLAIARALLHAPRLLLLDEPTLGLDAESVRQLMRVLEEEVAKATIVILVTHDSAIARQVAHDRFSMDRGRLVAAGGAAPA